MPGTSKDIVERRQSTEGRLDRIEDKIDRLSDALVLMARAEEKLVALEHKYAAQYERMNRFSEKLDAIDKAVTENNYTVQTINRLFWIAIAAAATAVVTNIWM